MKINRTGSAAWQGGLKDGRGTVSTESGQLAAAPYGFAMRFEGVKGTNPEELIGAAHAACFTMALSNILGQSNLVAEQLDTKARVTLEQGEGGFEITEIHLTLTGKVSGTDAAGFLALAEKAKAGCPVSQALGAIKVSLNASLA